LGKLISIPAPDYSTLSLRIPKLELDLGYETREGEEVVIAVDSTGMKVTNRGEWMRKKRKGYIKIHVAVDTKTKQVVSLEVTDERSDDGGKLVPLVRKARGRARVKRVLGMGATTHDNFEFLAAEGIEAGIKVREDSNPNCGGQRLGYGQRWMAETFFSGFKRLFSEVVHAKEFERMVKEIELKVWVYNLMLGLTVVPALAAAVARGVS